MNAVQIFHGFTNVSGLNFVECEVHNFLHSLPVISIAKVHLVKPAHGNFAGCLMTLLEKIVPVSIFTILIGCSQINSVEVSETARRGNAEAFTGTDHDLNKLNSAREILLQTLGHVRRRSNLDSLCAPLVCRNPEDPSCCMELDLDESYCQPMHVLSHNQQAQCRSFLTQTATSILKLYEGDGAATPPVYPVKFSASDSMPLISFFSDVLPSIPVPAKTLLGPLGEIEVWRGEIRRLSLVSLVALEAHEAGHKVAYASGCRKLEDGNYYVEDECRVGDFVTGRALLDAAGSALAIYYQKHLSPESQDP